METQRTIYMKFPSLQKFLDYIKEMCNIYEIGMVVRTIYHPSSRVNYFLRLTKHAPSLGVILVCDISFFDDIYCISDNDKIQQLKEEKIKEVTEAINKTLSTPSYAVKIIGAEFQLTAD